MPRHVEGRRVQSLDSLETPGDYFLKYAPGGGVESLLFVMPGFERPRWNRINGPLADREPRWDITEDTDGKVTVNPSIKSEWTVGEEKAQRRWHGYLKAGVWEILDDTITGAE